MQIYLMMELGKCYELLSMGFVEIALCIQIFGLFCKHSHHYLFIFSFFVLEKIKNKVFDNHLTFLFSTK